MTIGAQVIEVSVPGPQGPQGPQGIQGPQGVGVPSGGQNGYVMGYASGSAAWRAIRGTVSQSGGVPTGAIIERGSNANGEYVRYADGTQICWGEVDLTSAASTTANGSLFSVSGGATQSYPALFSASPNVFLTGERNNDQICGGSLKSNTLTSAFTYNVWSSVSLAATFTKFIQWMAIGRWF
ncbi:hypothetical protein GOC69_24120 [Sinorhizobium medicae]|nr:hypothetical protein [Sinorhizobium medicae]MDX0474988.1 hypothetical protein [Sinorhizobium medicae]